MFTGLVEEIGSIKGLRQVGDGALIEVACSEILPGTAIGDSISINGACQTVTALAPGYFTVFASRVTLEVTTLGAMRQGASVNLERALSAQSRFGGHIVQGHVDGRGVIRAARRSPQGLEVSVGLGRDLCRYLVSKGSVAVDGISLTVVDAGDESFTLYVIPETLTSTTAGRWKQGQEVNIEVDILAKYVERMLDTAATGRREEKDRSLARKLIEEGFV